MIVPGGISLDGTRWAPSRPAFLLPVHVLGKLFRRLFLTGSRALHAAGRLRFCGDRAGLNDPQAFEHHLASVRAARWVVYAKPPFGGPEAVLAYPSRYTHRVAIGNLRLIGMDDDGVTFRTRTIAATATPVTAPSACRYRRRPSIEAPAGNLDGSRDRGFASLDRPQSLTALDAPAKPP